MGQEEDDIVNTLAFTEGANAWKAGKTIEQNPYKYGEGDEFQDWNDGWWRAQSEFDEEEDEGF